MVEPLVVFFTQATCLPLGDIATWLNVLAADNRAVFTAAAHAQRAAEFINRKATDAAAQVSTTCAA